MAGVTAWRVMSRWVCGGVMALTLISPVGASDVALAGVIGKKAILVINGGQPQTLAVGQTSRDGVRLVEISPERNAAIVDIDGLRQRLELGRGAVRVAGATPEEAVLTLFADGKGHHFTDGSINGAGVRFLVDTGASSVAIGIGDARRARIDLDKAPRIRVQTASGPSTAWRVRMETVKVGPLVMYGVEGLVMENDLPVALLGMSFLSRTEMSREGDRMLLRKRY